MKLWPLLLTLLLIPASAIALQPSPEVNCCYELQGGELPEYCNEYENINEEACESVVAGWNDLLDTFYQEQEENELRKTFCCIDVVRRNEVGPECEGFVLDYDRCDVIATEYFLSAEHQGCLTGNFGAVGCTPINPLVTLLVATGLIAGIGLGIRQIFKKRKKKKGKK